MGARVIRIGTRSSALARAQTALIAAGLIDAHHDSSLVTITHQKMQMLSRNSSRQR